MSRKTDYKRRKRYDGTLESLKDRSCTPHHSPRKQSVAEIKLVEQLARKYRGDLLQGYEKACKRGYARIYGCFKKTAAKLVRSEKKCRARKNKPYQHAEYPGQKVEIDVKFVPSY